MENIKPPKFDSPFLSEKDFYIAVDIIERHIYDKEVLGHEPPWVSPGGNYDGCWWSLDEALALSGYRFIDAGLSRRCFLSLMKTQRPDGRVLLWGNDFIPHIEITDRMSVVSSLPKYFNVGYDLCAETDDDAFMKRVYISLDKSLEWWFRERQDKETGLISAIFEETFVPYLGGFFEYAPPDTNAEIIFACEYVADIAERLGDKRRAEYWRAKQSSLEKAVNAYLWDEKDGFYYPYLLKERKLKKVKLSSAFSLFSVADENMRYALRMHLTNHSEFNWDTIPVTTIAKDDLEFIAAEGDIYTGNSFWSGNVWTLTNETILRALIKAGEYALALDLALKTVKVFAGNYAETINPFTGKRQGVKDYVWTAAQVIKIAMKDIPELTSRTSY